MANKKGSKKGKGKKGSRKKRSAAFAAFLRSKQFAHIRGAFYILFAAFLIIALAGYFVTGNGWLGSAGHGLAEFFAVNLFGIGSLGFVLLLFVYGMRLWDIVVMPWWKTFGSVLFWMLWCSLTLGYIGGAWVKNPDFERFAGIGLQMAEPLHHWLRWWTLVLLVFAAVVFLVMVHKMELPEITMPKVDLKKAVESIEHEIEKVATDHSEDEEEVKGGTLKEDVKAKKSAPANPQTVSSPKTTTFDEEAMRLFNSTPKTETPTPTSTEVEFDIDKAFSEVNAKAQGSSEINFTVEGYDKESNQSNESEVSDQTDLPDQPETELEPDDYRRHYGLDDPYDPHLDLSDYIMPSTDMLEDWEVANTKVTMEELVANKDRIVQTLHDYGIEITDITATTGPTVTLYKIRPAPGVRISKIKNLEDDIALSLAALGIRIIAPIPGESLR